MLFFPRVILCTFLLFLLIYGGLGVEVLGLGFSVDGLFWGRGSLYKHRRINRGKNFASDIEGRGHSWLNLGKN